MRKYTKITVEEDRIDSVVCDVCKKEYKFSDQRERLELQEFTHVKFFGGYGSIFGDGVKVECDICQHCLEEKLSPYLRFDE